MRRFIFFILAVFLLNSCAVNNNPPILTTLPMVTGLAAKGGIREVGLSWNVVNDSRIEGYVLYRAPQATGPYQEIARIPDKLKTTYVDTGGFLKHLEDNTEYFYKIAVYSSKGVGPTSNYVVGKTLPPPVSPTKITATSGLPRMVVIRWQPSNDHTVVAYNIYRSTKPKGPFKKIGRVDGYVNTIYIDKGLKDGTTYYYSVVSVNFKGVEGDILAVAKATTKFKPMPPRNLSAVQKGAGQLTIYWFPSMTADVVKYRIYRGETKQSMVMVGEVSSSKLQFLDKGLAPGKTYYYYVTAVDKDGIESLPSKTYAFKTKPLPLPPVGISVKQVGNSVVINWSNGSPDTVEYEVFRRHFLIFTKKIAVTKNTYFTDDAVSPNTTYYYYVKAVDKFGQESQPSPEVKITVR